MRCTVCNGAGKISQEMNSETVAQIDCEDCEGVGFTVPPCLTCSGLGFVRAQVTEKIKIPAGVY